MNVQIRGFCQRSETGNEPGQPITFVAATDKIARDGLVIEKDAWQLDNYRANPVVLWAHDYMGGRAPIGKASNLRMDSGNLLADITFDQDDPFAVDVERKYRNGYLNAVSVGWDTLETKSADNPNVYAIITRADLLDISCVPVPGDADALIARQKRAFAQMGRELLKIAGDDPAPNPDPTPPPAAPAARASWDETAAAMVALYRPYAQRPDQERKTEHLKWSREYARLRKTPPEFLSQPELDSLSMDEIRGLFLEGEPELHARAFAEMESRAGAVLSQRNRDDLARAVALVQGVIDRAAKDAAEDDPDDDDEERALLDALNNVRELLPATGA